MIKILIKNQKKKWYNFKQISQKIKLIIKLLININLNYVINKFFFKKLIFIY